MESGKDIDDTRQKHTNSEEQRIDVEQGISDNEKIQKELLWGLYQEFRSHVRHSETIRSTVTSYMLVIASALITVITFDNEINHYDLPLSLIVSLVGLLSGLFSVLYTDRYVRHGGRASKVLKELDNLFFAGKAQYTLSGLKEEADQDHRQKYSEGFMGKMARWTRRIGRSTHFFWITLPLVVFLIGIVLTILSLLNNNTVSPPTVTP